MNPLKEKLYEVCKELKDAAESITDDMHFSTQTTVYDEDGNSFSGTVRVGFTDLDEFYDERDICDLIEEEIAEDFDHNEEINTDHASWIFEKWMGPRGTEEQAANYIKSNILLALLARACDEWRDKYHGLSWEELKSNPLPAIKK